METWKPILHYEGLYEISDLGNIKSLYNVYIRSDGIKSCKKERIMFKGKDKKGYVRIKIRNKGHDFSKLAHRLVAEAFIPNPENKPQVNHKNGIKDDNRVNNLEWVTNEENKNHAIENGLFRYLKGEEHGNSILTDKIVNEIKLSYNDGMRIKDISEKINIPVLLIRSVIYGTAWKSHTGIIIKRDDRSKKDKKNVITQVLTNFYRNNKSASIPINQIEDNKIIKTYFSISDASKKTSIPRKSIEAVAKGRMKSAGGYFWEKANIKQIEKYI